MEGELNNNQENQHSHGGKREGAGRPVGSGHKPKIVDDLTEEQKEDLLKVIFDKAIKGDSKLLQFLAEQIYGKARQNVGLDGGEDDKPILQQIKVLFKDFTDGDNTE